VGKDPVWFLFVACVFDRFSIPCMHMPQRLYMKEMDEDMALLIHHDWPRPPLPISATSAISSRWSWSLLGGGTSLPRPPLTTSPWEPTGGTPPSTRKNQDHPFSQFMKKASHESEGEHLPGTRSGGVLINHRERPIGRVPSLDTFRGRSCDLLDNTVGRSRVLGLHVTRCCKCENFRAKC